MKGWLSLLVLVLLPVAGWTQDFTVNLYTVDIQLMEEGHFEVVERYDLTFEVPKHGIYRTIQTQYEVRDSTGQRDKRKIKVDHIEVPNYNFEVPFDFVQRMNDHLEIKIGDKDITLIGPQHYEIRYRVHNALLFEGDKIRFYWNLKPEGWNAVFQQIQFNIHVPEDVELNNENSFVYSGERGTDILSTDFELQYGKGTVMGKSKDNFRSFPGQSVTILIDLPPNSIKEVKPLWPFWNQYGWVFIMGALIGVFYRTWWQYGKDNKVIAATSYYPPVAMDPAMVGFLINDREDHTDLISLLPYWGSKGLIAIQEIEKEGLFGKADTKLIKLNSLPTDAPDYERELFHSLFGRDGATGAEGTTVLVSSLKDTFYTKMAKAGSLLKAAAQPYYEPHSKKVRNIVYVCLVAALLLLGWAGLQFWGILALMGITLTCVVLLVLNFYMIKKNAKGNRVLSELMGFRQFIKVAEAPKLKMLLAEDPHYFESTMGYALAFGMFTKWADKFEALEVRPPSWYSTTSVHLMGMQQFSRSFSSAMDGARTTMVSSPSSSGSSGGGSSGGGFGGGGGGSW